MGTSNSSAFATIRVCAKTCNYLHRAPTGARQYAQAPQPCAAHRATFGASFAHAADNRLAATSDFGYSSSFAAAPECLYLGKKVFGVIGTTMLGASLGFTALLITTIAHLGDNGADPNAEVLVWVPAAVGLAVGLYVVSRIPTCHTAV